MWVMGETIIEFSERNNEDKLSNEIEKTKVKTNFQGKYLDSEIRHLPIFLSSFDSPRWAHAKIKQFPKVHTENMICWQPILF